MGVSRGNPIFLWPVNDEEKGHLRDGFKSLRVRCQKAPSARSSRSRRTWLRLAGDSPEKIPKNKPPGPGGLSPDR